MTYRIARIVISGLLLSGIAGCGGSGGASQSKLPSVAGRVYMIGKKGDVKEIDFATLQFHPADGTTDAKIKIWSPVGEGHFYIMTEEDGEKNQGAPEGDYIVTIVSDKNAPPNLRVPTKYGSTKTSDLKAHVEEGENEPLEFELKE